MPENTVSVVIPCFNGSRFLGDALASLAAQTIQPLEVIVVDDGSRPEERDTIARLCAAAAPLCRAIHLPKNRGVCVARNIGIARAKGTHIAFLDCDDMWVPEKLEKQMRFFAEHPDYRAVHSGLQVNYPDGRTLIAHKTEVAFNDLVEFPCPIFPSTLIVDREALFECGLFNPTKKVCEDLDLFLRITSQYPIGCVDEPLIIRRIHDECASRNLRAFHHDADRVYRDFQYVFADQAAATDTLAEIQSDFLLQALYARDPKLFLQVLRRATAPEVAAPKLVARTLVSLVRNWRARNGASGHSDGREGSGDD